VTLSAAPAKGAGRSTSSESYGQIDNETALVTKAAVSLSTTSITALAPTALADFIDTLRGQIARRAVDVDLQAVAKRHRILRNQPLRRFHPDAWA